jgi:hypothetical protein
MGRARDSHCKCRYLHATYSQKHECSKGRPSCAKRLERTSYAQFILATLFKTHAREHRRVRTSNIYVAMAKKHHHPAVFLPRAHRGKRLTRPAML